MPAASSKSFKALIWKALDRILFVGLGAAATIATTYVTGILKLSPPKLVATPIFNRVDNAPITENIGGMNPVVLGASFLSFLADKGVISLSEAQGVLDGAVKR